MLSMLRQMLCEDKAESVRQAVVRSLGVIVAFTHDEDKFKEVSPPSLPPSLPLLAAVHNSSGSSCCEH